MPKVDMTNINKRSLENEWLERKNKSRDWGRYYDKRRGKNAVEMDRQMYSAAENENQYDTERAGHTSAHRHGNS